ncbi:hypothetical protein ABGB17_28680 [Sphaerisporangium sp. B11E5]|uniref:hypothetical protein n=1 Tax=Sphaerisporangium sp. B11E5 TaxID=3153563 RepID=UPI00325D959B
MLSSVRRHRTFRSLTLALVALVALLLPVTPAHATYGSPLTVWAVTYGNGGSTELARVDGNLYFDDGNTKIYYDLSLCRRSSFTAPYVRVLINGVNYTNLYWSGGSSTAVCPSFYTATPHAAEINYGSTITSVSLILVSSEFPNNVYTERTKRRDYDNPYN